MVPDAVAGGGGVGFSSARVKSTLSSAGNLVVPQPVGIRWKNLRYYVRVPRSRAERREGLRTRKEILRGISGYASPGHLMAVMGSSGAGKTTLLNVLAHRTAQGGSCEGEVLFNGARYDECARALRTLAAYITQEDLVMKTQTAREILTFSAHARLGRHSTREDKRRVVEEVLRLLRLQGCADTIVGDPESGGVSGGERKRINIGVELVTNPSILYVDEPTSGLDSSTARTVMEVQRELAKEGRTVLVTIHQPSSEVFFMFSRLLLLHKGSSVYFGAIDDAVRYFGDLGFMCPAHYNPADFCLSVLLDSTAGNDSSNTDFIAKWREHVTEAALCEPDAALAALPAPDAAEARPLGFLGETGLIFARTLRNFTRERMLFQARIGQTLFFGLLSGLLFLNLTDNTQGVQDRLGLLFFMSINQLMLPLLGSVLTFPAEKEIFRREHRSGFYTVNSYFTAKSLAELPFQVVFPLIFTIIVYFMTGLRPGTDHFFLAAFFMILDAVAAQSMGLMIGAAAATPAIAIMLVGFVLIPTILAGGFFASRNRLDPAWLWLEYISILSWVFQGLCVNEFGGDRVLCQCAADDADPLSIVDACTAVCGCASTECIFGDNVLASQYMSDSSIGTSVGALAIITLVFRALLWLALFMKTRV